MTVRAAAAVLAIAWCATTAHAAPADAVPADAAGARADAAAAISRADEVPADAAGVRADAAAAIPRADVVPADAAGARADGAAAIPRADEVPADAAADFAAGETFRAAQQRAAAGDPAALAAYEALGTARPITRWSDDAWAEAARLAERAGDFARARLALEQVIAIGTDDQLVRRARGTLTRLATMTGDGRWDTVAKEHDRLVSEVFGGDDPRAELAALAALLEEHPDYPRANAIRGALARGWEQEGDQGLALRWYRAAAVAGIAEPGRRSHLALIRALLRADDLDAAESEIEQLARATSAHAQDAGPIARVDGAGLRAVRAQLATARQRAWIRRGLWGLTAGLALIAIFALRRDAGSFTAAGRRLARPPLEVVFLVPLAALLIIVGYRGNPLVAQAVRDIAIAGVAIAWISGALLEATRARHGRVPVRRALIHAGLAVIAVAAMAYLALDRDHLLDLVMETWRGGPGLR